MHVGEVLRAARERRGWSLSELAAETGLSPGHLSRIETGGREPSWATLRLIAGVWNLEPLLHLVATEAERRTKAAALSHLEPEERLARLNFPVFDAAMILARSVDDAALTGAAAALLQGVSIDVERLEAVVPDTDRAIEQLVRLVMRSFCLYEELPPDAFRALGRVEWVVREADAVIRLAAELPPTLRMTLDGIPVSVVALPHLLATDPVVADAVGAPPPGGA